MSWCGSSFSRCRCRFVRVFSGNDRCGRDVSALPIAAAFGHRAAATPASQCGSNDRLVRRVRLPRSTSRTSAGRNESVCSNTSRANVGFYTPPLRLVNTTHARETPCPAAIPWTTSTPFAPGAQEKPPRSVFRSQSPSAGSFAGTTKPEQAESPLRLPAHPL
jgi:hypothetical protein